MPDETLTQEETSEGAYILRGLKLHFTNEEFFLVKQKRKNFLLETCLAKLTPRNYLGPHKEKPVVRVAQWLAHMPPVPAASGSTLSVL